MRQPKKFLRDRSSLAALEFAIVLPIMILLLAGVYDFSEAAIIRAEVYDAADTMVASASSLAVQQDGSTTLTYQQVQLVESSIWALVPNLRAGIAQNNGSPKSITMSSVLFYPNPYAPCTYGQTTACSYIADVAWSVAYTGGGNSSSFTNNLPSTADCTQAFSSPTASQVSASASLSGTDNVSYFRTLDVATSTAKFGDTGTAQNEAGVAPILVVNIQYTYTPLFTFFLVKPFTFWVNGYWPVRTVKNVAANTVNFGYGNVTVQPLSKQFTTINASSLPSSKTSYCVNPSVSGAST